MSPLRRLLRVLTGEVSAALDRHALERSRRGEARVALLQAWVVLNGPARSASRGLLVRWVRRLDRLLVPALPVPRLSFQPLLNRIDRRFREPRSPIQQRLQSLERSVEALARRTQGMVEHAEQTARGIGQPPPERTEDRTGGREPLELVWGEEE